jgi:hypothetical protein
MLPKVDRHQLPKNPDPLEILRAPSTLGRFRSVMSGGGLLKPNPLEAQVVQGFFRAVVMVGWARLES